MFCIKTSVIHVRVSYSSNLNRLRWCYADTTKSAGLPVSFECVCVVSRCLETLFACFHFIVFLSVCLIFVDTMACDARTLCVYNSFAVVTGVFFVLVPLRIAFSLRVMERGDGACILCR